MSDCTICPDKPGHGWKVVGVTHCKKCHTTWRMGTKVTHCVTCHETFSTDSNCERHQKATKTEPWGCRPPESVGLVPTIREVAGQSVTVWQMPGQAWIDLSAPTGDDPDEWWLS